MAAVIIAVLAVSLLVIGFVTLTQNSDNTHPQTISNRTPRPTPVFSANRTQSDQDPIIGSWLNGMVFYPNGSVGSDGLVSWKVNENANNSYFVVTLSHGTTGNGDMTIDPAASATEWLYNPATDRINKRGSSEFIARGIPKPTPRPTTPKLTTTTPIRTQTTTVVRTTEGPFNYENCITACKMQYWADRDKIGLYNDCVQTCNIENLKGSA